MLVRYGLAQILAFLPSLVVAAGPLAAAGKLSTTRPGLAKTVLGTGLLVVLSYATVVWVVDERDAGALAARRYLLWGASGMAAALDGRPIPVAVGEGVDGVVNATRVTLVVEAAHYGSTFGSSEKPEPLAPGTSRTYGYSINDVGDPPRLPESKRAPVSVLHYIRRAR